MSSSRLIAFAYLVLAATAAGQFTQTIGVTGTTLAGSSFTMRLEAAPTFLRDLDFLGADLPVDTPPLAMASLMVARINIDYLANGKSGFTASSPAETSGRSKFDATFELHCNVSITDVKVGTLGNPTIPIPRPPGIAFNPTIFDYRSTTTAFGNIPFIGAQVGSANANFTVNGIDPAQDFQRRIKQIIGTPLSLEVSSGANANAPFFMLAGPFFHGAFQMPITGDFLDIGQPLSPGAVPIGISIVGDGIGFLTGSIWDTLFRTDSNGFFGLVLTNTGGLTPTQIALQVGVFDPTVIFGFKLTQAADIHFAHGQRVNLPVSSDGVAPLAFDHGQFLFYGQTFTGIIAHENGIVSFGSSINPGGGLVIDPIAAAGGPPAIFANWADWDLSGTPGIEIDEFGRETRIGWGTAGGVGISHFGDVDQASFECVLIRTVSPVPDPDVGTVVLDLIAIDPLAMDGNATVIGIQPGMNLDPAPFSRSLGLNQSASSPFGSLLWQSGGNAMGVGSVLNVASGGPGVYQIGAGLHDREFTFTPSPSGMSAYRSFANKPNPPDLQAVTNGANLSSGGTGLIQGQTITLSGYFQHLILPNLGPPTLQRVILTQQGAPIASGFSLQTVGIMDDTMTLPPGVPTIPVAPGFHSFEGLVVQFGNPIPVPAGPPIVLDLHAVFDTGDVFTLPNAVTISF